LRRQRVVDHLAPRASGRAAHAADRRDPGLLLRHARRVVAELPWHRYPAAGHQLGSDVLAGPHLPAHRVVAVVLPRPGHRHHHGLVDYPRAVGTDPHRSGPAVAAYRPAEAPFQIHQDHEAHLKGADMTAAVDHKTSLEATDAQPVLDVDGLTVDIRTISGT